MSGMDSRLRGNDKRAWMVSRCWGLMGYWRRMVNRGLAVLLGDVAAKRLDLVYGVGDGGHFELDFGGSGFDFDGGAY